MRSDQSIKAFWNKAAEANPYWYVSSYGFICADRNLEEFWASGRTIWADIKRVTGYTPRLTYICRDRLRRREANADYCTRSQTGNRTGYFRKHACDRTASRAAERGVSCRRRVCTSRHSRQFRRFCRRVLRVPAPAFICCAKVLFGRNVSRCQIRVFDSVHFGS